MADELSKSIGRLCVAAGMLMEDITIDTVSTLPSDPAKRVTKLTDLRETSADIAALLAAAEVLDRRAGLFRE